MSLIRNIEQKILEIMKSHLSVETKVDPDRFSFSTKCVVDEFIVYQDDVDLEPMYQAFKKRLEEEGWDPNS